MAFIYTALNTGTPALDPLVARIYADGVDVYPANLIGGVFTPPHELRGCTRFQWEFDHERDGTFVEISGATEDTYQVPESAVENSGDYRCVITIGELDGECEETTDVRTVAIIDCGNASTIFFNGSGGNGSRTIAPVFPHFLSSLVAITSPDWITHTDIVCVESSGNCVEISTLTAVATTSGGRANRARNGYVDIQIGEFSCSYPVQQNFIRTQMGGPITAEDLAPPLGPTLSLSSFQRSVVQNAALIVTGTSDVIGTSGRETTLTQADFAWTVDTGTVGTPTTTGGVSTITTSLDTSSVGDQTVIFTVTHNGFTVTESITVTVNASVAAEQAGEVTGDNTGQVQARTSRGVVFGDPPMNFYERNLATASGNFRVVSGLATIDARIDDGRGLFQNQPFGGRATMTFTINGPGIANGSFTQEVSVTPEPVDPNPVAFGDPGFTFNLLPVSVIIPSDVITGREDGLLVPGNYSWSMDLHRVAGLPGDGSINDTGVILVQASPRQEGITDPDGRFRFAHQLYNPRGSIAVAPVGGFAFDISDFNFDF